VYNFFGGTYHLHVQGTEQQIGAHILLCNAPEAAHYGKKISLICSQKFQMSSNVKHELLTFLQLHGSVIRDLAFMHPSWPWVHGQQSALLTAGGDGTCKVSTLDGRVLHAFQAGHQVNTVCPTPEPYNIGADDGFYSECKI
jgi:hypothetical protein